MQISEAFSEVIELASALGFSSIKDLPGCCEIDVDERWFVAINGHKEDVECSKGAKVPPYNVYVEWNGWPAGFFGARGGTICAGAAANEDTLVAALKAARARQVEEKEA